MMCAIVTVIFSGLVSCLSVPLASGIQVSQITFPLRIVVRIVVIVSDSACVASCVCMCVCLVREEMSP